jgi:hypothetical protein
MMTLNIKNTRSIVVLNIVTNLFGSHFFSTQSSSFKKFNMFFLNKDKSNLSEENKFKKYKVSYNKNILQL